MRISATGGPRQPADSRSFFNAFLAIFVLLVFYGIGIGSKTISGWRSMMRKSDPVEHPPRRCQDRLTSAVFLGALSVVWAVVVYFLICTPKNSRWLTVEERARAHARLISNQAGESESGIAVNWAEVREVSVTTGLNRDRRL